MCGIAGILNIVGKFTREQLAEYALAMAQTMTHRGPDDDGVWVDPQGLCALSQRRLAIIDLSPAGHQPRISNDGRRVITFNGEIYNYRSLKNELQQRGVSIRSSTDTEVLIEALRVFGRDVYQHLDGMYAFGLWNKAVRSLTLARDSFGEKPLYYTFQNGYFAFASELHALTVLPGFDSSVDTDAVAQYLAFQYIHAPRSIYRSVRKLEPGHWMEVLPDGRSSIHQHFSFEPTGASTRDRTLDDLADELEVLLAGSVESRMISDVPLGAFLSGGVDSTTVAAMMRKHGKVKSFSIGFEGAPESEHLAARETARLLGTEHSDQVLCPDVLNLVRTIGECLDEPNADSSCLPTYLLSQFTRRHVTVALSGDGGDELFGGYGRYFSTLEENARKHSGDPALQGWSAGNAYFSSRLLIFQEPEVTALLGNSNASLSGRLHSLRNFLDMGSGTLLARMRSCDTHLYLPGAVLAKVDRMSMQHSLEVRAPFLNRDIARFASHLSDSSCYAAGHGKLVLKQLASRYVPREWLDRPKQGFGLPTSIWGKDALLKLAKSILSGSECRTRNFLDEAGLDDFLVRQESAFSIYQLWSLLILELWLRSHHVSSSQQIEVDSISPMPEYAINEYSDHGFSARISNGSALPELSSQVDLLDNTKHSLSSIVQLHNVTAHHAPERLTLMALQFEDIPFVIPPQVRVIIKSSTQQEPKSSRIIYDDWTHPGYWQNSLPKQELRDRDCLVLSAPLILLPPNALTVLAQHGVKSIIYWDAKKWWKIELDRKGILLSSPQRLRFATTLMNLGSYVSRVCDKVRLAIARRIIKYWGIVLPKGPTGYLQEIQYCYRAELPMYFPLADGVNGNISRLLLFENETLLQAHSPHNLIRSSGKGLYSHWESGVLFSTSDNSNPNSNSREYTYIAKNRLHKAASLLGIKPELFFHSIRELKAHTPSYILNNQQTSSTTYRYSEIFPYVCNWLFARAIDSLDVSNSAELMERFLIEDRAQERQKYLPNAMTGSVAMYIGSLGAGGAERQLCYMAKGLVERGVRVTVLTHFHCSESLMHYLPHLEEAGVEVRFVSSPHPVAIAGLLNRAGDNIEALQLLRRLPEYLRQDVFNLWTHLVQLRPSVLHCWLDQPNIIGGVAGLMAGIERIVCSTRNYNPTCFPYIYQPWLHYWYRVLSRSRRVAFIANSASGAMSYANWLGVSQTLFSVIPNGFDPISLPVPTNHSVQAIREILGISGETTPVILGVFRLSAEKCPLDFLKVISIVRHTFPNVRAFIAGEGAMKQIIEQEIIQGGLGDCVTLLGRQDPIAPLYKVAHLLLLTSRYEGMPNVIVEALSFRLPVVSTMVGAIPEIVQHGKSGYLSVPGDIQSMAKHCIDILNNPSLQQNLGSNGQSFVYESLGLERMVDSTIATYDQKVHFHSNSTSLAVASNIGKVPSNSKSPRAAA